MVEKTENNVRKTTMAQPAHTETHHDAVPHEDHPTGWRRFVYSTNHKDIGTMYLVFAMMGGVIGGILSIAMRLELMNPGMQIFSDPEVFNVFVASHGLIMVFFMVMPAMTGGNGVGAGWTLYAPLTTKGTPGIAMDFAILSLPLAGASSILGAINFITTIFNMRAPGMTL